MQSRDVNRLNKKVNGSSFFLIEISGGRSFLRIHDGFSGLVQLEKASPRAVGEDEGLLAQAAGSAAVTAPAFDEQL